MTVEHLSSFLVALLLIVSSAALMVWHVRTWRRLRQEESSEREQDFRRRQFRRRMQTSAMLGVLGAAILVGQLLLPVIHSRMFLVIYWSGVLVLVFWIALLAIADVVATSFYYSREKSEFVIQHAKLQAEARKARDEKARASNGKPH